MATYVLPQVLVFQDFTIAPAVAANPLSSHIAGGHAYLTRTTDADEKEDGFLGYYENTSSNAFLWPTRPAGALVDTTYTKVYIENALLQYLDDGIGEDNRIDTVANYRNRIKATALNFATNGTYARSAEFYDRDVEVGDDIRVRALPDGGGDAILLWTSIKSLIANEIEAVVASATTNTANSATSSASVAITKQGGPDNCVTVVDGAGSAYDGITDGYTSETYTIIVTENSTGGAFETGRIRVISASGTDDVAAFAPGGMTESTAIGTRGLTVAFQDDDGVACSTSADDDSVTYNDIIKTQQWKVVVTQLWVNTLASTTIGNLSTYTTTTSTTYLVTVSRGGLYSATDVNLKPQISVSTTNGIDQSGPHTVSDHDEDITIGSLGVVIQFSDNGGATAGLVKTDRYTVPVTGVKSGAIQTLELADNIDPLVDPTAAGSEEVGIELYIRKPLLEVPENRATFAPVTNWQQSSTEITISSGINAYDDSYTDDGVLKALNVFSCSSCKYGKVYVTYRAWEVTKANSIFSISDVGDIDDISGSLTPDNPLKWGVFKALSNSNNTPVLYTSVTDPADADDWDEILDLSQARDDIHAMVPLTRNATVLGLYQAHVGAMSTESSGLWRTAWFNLQGIPEIPLVSTGSTVPGHTTATTSDGEECMAVFEDDPNSTTVEYTLVRNEAAGASVINGKFETNGVRAGDIVRAEYAPDDFGNFTYQEFVVDSVLSEQTLLVKTGPDQEISDAAKIEIWRTLNLTEEATEIASDAGTYYDRRIMAIWPDEIESSGTIQEGFHLCAALAGLTSGVLPQQGLTRLGISGFSDVQRTTRFSKSQLDTMALSGTWIVMQAPDGNIFTRQAVTTGNYSDINQREEMLTRNVDSISYRFKDYFEPFIGVTNVTPSMAAVIQAGISTLITLLQVERFTVNLGGQLIDAELESFAVSPIFKDRYVAKLLINVPYALNNFELHLVV